MISEGSCDTEDWSNDAGNSALPTQEKKIILKYIADIVILFHSITVFTVFLALVSVRDFFQKH